MEVWRSVFRGGSSIYEGPEVGTFCVRRNNKAIVPEAE